MFFFFFCSGGDAVVVVVVVAIAVVTALHDMRVFFFFWFSHPIVAADSESTWSFSLSPPLTYSFFLLFHVLLSLIHI